MLLYKLEVFQFKINSSKGKVRVSKCCYISIDLRIVRKPGKDPTGIQTHSPGYPIGFKKVVQAIYMRAEQGLQRSGMKFMS